MRSLIFSDPHGYLDDLDKALNHYPMFEYVYGLGDYGVSIHELECRNVTGVRGNMYTDPKTYPEDLIVEKEGFRILFTHGHHHSVKGSLISLYTYAKENNIDVCFYGHTHEAKISSIGDIYFINPGSCGNPFIPDCPTAILMNLKNKEMNVEIIDLNTYETYEEINIRK